MSTKSSANRPSAPWHATAAYLYTVDLSLPELAWEYLRRNPDYRAQWSAHSDTRHIWAPQWGCRFAEDPALDARRASPVWLSVSSPMFRLEKTQRQAEAPLLDLWCIPGRKQLVVDEAGLMLAAVQGNHRLACRLDDRLEAGNMFDLYMRVGGDLPDDRPSLAAIAAQWLASVAPPERAVAATRSSALHMRALQALDAKQAGASQRDIAAAVFGAETTRARWSVDGELRAQTRHLLRRAKSLMQGGYRALAALPPRQGDDEVG